MAYIGNTVTTQGFTPAVDYFNGDGSTVAFTLSKPVASVAQVQAVIENVPQNPGSAYTVSGNTITFTSAPPSGTANVYVYYTSPITQVIAPSQGTVGGTELKSNIEVPTTLAFDTTTLVIDGANNRVGVGTASPAQALHVSNGLTSSCRVRIENLDNYVDVIADNGDAIFGIDGTEKIRILSSGGITFNGDTAAANALDDYEEGTWTPVFNGTGGNPTVTYTLQYGYYTKIGRQVFVSGLVGISAFSGGGGNVSIAGLPFTVSNDDQNYPIGSLGQMSGFTSVFGNVDGQLIALRPNQNSTRMNIQESYELNVSDWSTTNIGASFTARFSASYFV